MPNNYNCNCYYNKLLKITVKASEWFSFPLELEDLFLPSVSEKVSFCILANHKWALVPIDRLKNRKTVIRFRLVHTAH